MSNKRNLIIAYNSITELNFLKFFSSAKITFLFFVTNPRVLAQFVQKWQADKDSFFKVQKTKKLIWPLHCIFFILTLLSTVHYSENEVWHIKIAVNFQLTPTV